MDTLNIPDCVLLAIIQYTMREVIFLAVNTVNQAHTLQIIMTDFYVWIVHQENLLIRRDLLHALIVQLVRLVLGDMHTRQDIMELLLVHVGQDNTIMTLVVPLYVQTVLLVSIIIMVYKQHVQFVLLAHMRPPLACLCVKTVG